jgi:hypothetical protein
MPPLHTFCIFLPRYVAWHPTSILPSRTRPCLQCFRLRPFWRRTTHPSGSRLFEVSPPRPNLCPWHHRAPENLRYPAVSNRDHMIITDVMVPLRCHPLCGSRQRRRQLNKLKAGHLKGAEVRTNQILWLVAIPFSSLTPQPQRPVPV